MALGALAGGGGALAGGGGPPPVDLFRAYEMPTDRPAMRPDDQPEFPLDGAPDDPAVIVPGLWDQSPRVLPGTRVAVLVTGEDRFAYVAPLESRIGEAYLLVACLPGGGARVGLNWPPARGQGAAVRYAAQVGGAWRALNVTAPRADLPEFVPLAPADGAALLGALRQGQTVKVRRTGAGQTAVLTLPGRGMAAAWRELGACRPAAP
ncbi:hypothetical protein [Deinococcus multiflagellatus]|uniref:Uncharacterized protein n=1 Tax=Deinococcus multiflagellatus TaxID=1656887 RepID=A0ABW1ZFM8_9DEIO|nr:hypothetical protein [Deinococcus multiflagellatus]MBZ9711881.1 hypothetical protein [Deinococcus multiflagellatus]